jgi:4-amino-4-deoxy-L-arabinose transferase-like glycosyltransferase
LYSLALSGWLWLVPSPDEAARYLSALLMGANTFLAGWLTGLLASSAAAALIGALVFVGSEETILLHSWAMSDGLYLFLALLTVAIASRSRNPEARTQDVVLASGTAGLAFLTRYVGLSLFVIPLEGLLSLRAAGWARARAAVVGFSLAILACLLWLARNLVLTDSATNRRLGVFVQGASWWQGLARVVESWLVPGRVQHFLEEARIPPGSLLILGVVAALVVALWVRMTADPWGLQARLTTWLPLILVVPIHLGAITASAWLTYPGPDLNARNMAPVLVALSILFVASLGVVWSRGSGVAKVLAGIMAVSFAALEVYAGWDTAARLLKDGQGYTSAAWESSETIRGLRERNPGLVYTNDIGAVYYFTGKYAYEIPHRYEPITGRQREDYGEEVCRMQARLRERDGLVVFFSLGSPLPELLTRDDLGTLLQPIAEHLDGAIFRSADGPPPDCGPEGRG